MDEDLLAAAEEIARLIRRGEINPWDYEELVALYEEMEQEI